MLFHRGDGVLREREEQRIAFGDLSGEKLSHFFNSLKLIDYHICFFNGFFNLRVVSFGFL